MASNGAATHAPRQLITERTPRVCGLGQPGHVCNTPAAGVVAIHVITGRHRGDREPGLVLLCTEHFALFPDAQNASPASEPDPAVPS